jgi:hypothetical protein
VPRRVVSSPRDRRCVPRVVRAISRGRHRGRRWIAAIDRTRRNRHGLRRRRRRIVARSGWARAPRFVSGASRRRVLRRQRAVARKLRRATRGRSSRVAHRADVRDRSGLRGLGVRPRRDDELGLGAIAAPTRRPRSRALRQCIRLSLRRLLRTVASRHARARRRTTARRVGRGRHFTRRVARDDRRDAVGVGGLHRSQGRARRSGARRHRGDRCGR